MIGLTTTKPNCHLAWRRIRESWAPGQTLSLWSGRKRLITTEWPHWLQMSNCPTTTPPLPAAPSNPRLSPRYFPEVHKSCVSPFFTDAGREEEKRSRPPFKFMRMMLMSVSRILMTLQINWALIEVPLSVWSFFFVRPSAAEALAKA